MNVQFFAGLASTEPEQPPVSQTIIGRRGERNIPAVNVIDPPGLIFADCAAWSAAQYLISKASTNPTNN